MFLAARRQIAALALVARLPTIYNFREHVEDGDLICHGINLKENYRRGAYFVDRILKGEKPANLPIEFPTKVELIINLATAKALGLEIPPTLLARADEVIERFGGASSSRCSATPQRRRSRRVRSSPRCR
jgi:putative ABC transport system substrate-binding protein